MIHDFFRRAYKWPEWAVATTVAALIFLPILALIAVKDGSTSPLLAAAWTLLAPALVLYLIDCAVKRHRRGATGTG